MELAHQIATTNVSFPLLNITISAAPVFILPWFRTAIHTCFLATFIVGVIANVLLCYFVYKRKEKRRTIHLLTLNVAASDLMVLLVYLPMQLYQINALMVWELGRVTCKIFYGINAATINANILTLIAITRDRYVAVTDPLTTHSRGTSSVKKWIFVIWLISIVLTLPLSVVVDVHNEYCYEVWPSMYLERFYWITLFAIQLVIPLIYFTSAYSIIIYRMRCTKYLADCTILNNYVGQCMLKHQRCAQLRKNQQAKLLRLAIILVVAYVVCVLPQHAVFFGATYGNLAQNPNAIYIFVISNFLLIFNSLLNPIVYASHSSNTKLQSYYEFFKAKMSRRSDVKT